MEIGIHLLKSVTVLSIFYIVYFLFLRKDTLFRIKRHYLLGGIITSIVVPFIEFTKTTYLPALVNHDPQLLDNSQIYEEVILPSSEVVLIDWWFIALIVYALGAIFFMTNLLIQLFSLLKLIRLYPSAKRGNYRFVKVSEAISPFSFFRYIVYNPSLHSEEELEMIIKHEQVHASQWHSIDIILANVIRCLQWINPFSWLYKKSIEENLEFIADNETVTQVTSKKQYQLTLVKASSPSIAPMITTQFYQSFIKKRIIMLNKSTSKRRNIWKVCIVLPLLALFLWSFNVKEVFEYEETIGATSEENSKAVFNIFPYTSDAELDYIEKVSRTDYKSGAVQISNRKRDALGQLKTFSFDTKFDNQKRYYSRFSTTNNKGYEIKFTGGPLILVTELGETGVQFKISKENLEFSETMAVLMQRADSVKRGKKIDSFRVNRIDSSQVEKIDSSQLKKTFYVLNKPSSKLKSLAPAPEFRIKITKNTSDEQLKAIKKEMIETHGIDLSYTVVRNSNREITSINLHYTGKGTSGAYSVNDDGPIDDFHFYMNNDGQSGFQSANNKGRNLKGTATQDRLERISNELAIQKEEQLHNSQNRFEHAVSQMENTEHRLREHEEELIIAQQQMQQERQEIREQQEQEEEKEEVQRLERRFNKNYTQNNVQHQSRTLIIDKNMSDADLKELKNDLKSHGVSFQYSKLRRNAKGEISRIKITVDNGKGSKSTTMTQADDGASIDHIAIEI